MTHISNEKSKYSKIGSISDYKIDFLYETIKQTTMLKSDFELSVNSTTMEKIAFQIGFFDSILNQFFRYPGPKCLEIFNGLAILVN